MAFSYPSTTHKRLLAFIDETKKLCKPDRVHWCDGSSQEYQTLCDLLEAKGTFTRLNEKLRPSCYLARTDPRDTFRPDSAAWVCSKSKESTGPTNQWSDPDAMKEKLNKLFDGCMVGRTMYIIPFCLGPIGSPYSRFGIEITDSPYVVVNMRIVARVDPKVLKLLGDDGFFFQCVHSVGSPLKPTVKDVTWPCNPTNTIVAHFTDEASVWSFGSGFGGNAILTKRSCGLRLASAVSRAEDKFIAANSPIVSVRAPNGHKYNILTGFPSGTGKTNVSLLVSTVPGWSLRCVSDELAWLNVSEDGQMVAINPENGFFGVATGMNDKSNISIMYAIQKNTIFTNVGMTPDGNVWWEGMTKDPPAELIDWTGEKWTPGCGRLAAHPNSRFTAPYTQCPVMDPDYDNPNGVHISAIVWGNRRKDTVPLVCEAFDWYHGILMGASISVDEMVARGKHLSAHYDALCMEPFVGCSMNDYIAKWMDYRKYLGYLSPKIFSVNWYLEGEDGSKIWPGFSENSRVFRWICDRVDDVGEYTRTAVGYVPTYRDFDTTGLGLTPQQVHKLIEVVPEQWLSEVKRLREHVEKFGTLRLHPAVGQQLKLLEKRLHLQEDEPPTHNKQLLEWVENVRALTTPDKVHWCTGTVEEYDELCAELVKAGTFIALNPKFRPNSYLARSDTADVARVESKTWICSDKKEDAGPTNNWGDPKEMKEKLNGLFKGCMKGRTMYIVPFCMGPLGSPFSRYGVEISDSPYVVVNMYVMTRMGIKALTAMGDQFFLKCLHSVGKPLQPGDVDSAWPCNPENTHIAHFPQEPSVMSFGSGYGGNALLGKKCYSLRVASVMGRKEGWLAEHMLILGLTSPEGKKLYVTAAFPSACGKTNLAMLVPTIPGWTVRCVGDDIAWLHVGEDGRLHAINPENGFFGVAPGTSVQSNFSAMHTVKKNTIFTNVALTPDGDVWWEGMTSTTPAELTDWTGQKWTPDCGRAAAHPNSRYTTPAAQCPVIDLEWENPNGVPISAIIFGGRRNSLVPLVAEAFTWHEGVFLGSIVSSETTAAAEGAAGKVRRDPFAMLPFCGYNMADYFKHWVDFRQFLGYNSPKIFYVNWFRRGADRKFLWPGFGENSRVLKWIASRIGRNPTGKSVRTPIGHVPTQDALDLTGLDMSGETMQKLISVDPEEWLAECKSIREFYATFGDKIPAELQGEVYELEKRCTAAVENNGHEPLLSPRNN